MRTEEELEEQLGWLFSAAVERDEVAEYLLGVRPYVIEGRAIERFYRLHETIHWLVSLPAEERETRTLHLAAAVAATARELAALLVAGVAEHPGEGWHPVADATYCAVAVQCGGLTDYLALRGNYIVPAWLQASSPQARQERFRDHYGQTHPDHARHALRLALLTLLDESGTVRRLTLSTCCSLAVDDPVLRSKVRERLLVAVQSGELAEIARGDAETAASMIHTLGQWQVAEALPFLREMARHGALPTAAQRPVAEALSQALAVLSRPRA